ncbi:FAD-containing monooxygenase EthA [Luteibacter rhizovicinus DSM 16549]|uniref:FAD-containing monooxygenase EthA n=1 Tax=Luteibacter rhizovicinus DSM 16549 TaxID=1440763 RepID=A0A1L3ENJ2_9GAMM|nr:NAD(P)/FAD-dependent oxidoreductase [Luteibacter rhizovicinus]APG02592.1 FAD-containing monooxygenase EthA [Luteibacter rhizovicinus DSM 16549]KLD73749.1 FAD-containing monooxygenase EthA [Xanthomonas hyacinthi DSM 19077]
MSTDHYDVLIIGAGLSGIGMACRLAMACPEKRVGILERRHAIGGTWDLFRYPGVRSDSDMFTFGYGFRPWNELKVLADGPSIREYVVATARDYGIEAKIRFGLSTTHASWSSVDARWTVTAVDEQGDEQVFTAGFLVGCTGYYAYDRGYIPAFPDLDRYKGRFVHPQVWPDDLDWEAKRVLVIGSGATAITLVPALAQKAEHVTMLQRSPGYVFSVPSRDALSAALLHVLPAGVVYAMARRRNIALQRLLYRAAMRWPRRMRALLLAGVRRRLDGAATLDDFSPTYDPWTQRLCVVPDNDLFDVLREGKASVWTDTVAGFTETGVRLSSGATIDADVVISATGFQVQVLGGMTLDVDGIARDPGRLLTYKGVLLDGVPNAAVLFGYINASWTLKVDLAAQYVCRLLQRMDERMAVVAVPRAPSGQALDTCILDALTSGYVMRGEAALPRQGRDAPWRVTHRYEDDRRVLLDEPVDDAWMEMF